MNFSSMSLEELQALEKDYSNRVAKHDIFQMSFKILLNSFYGAVGSERFSYFDVRFAEAITSTGKLATKTAIKIIDETLEKATGVKHSVMAADTDSAYFTMEKLVEKHCEGMSDDQIVTWLDKFCSTILQKVIDRGYQDLQDYLNCPQNTMDMEREVIAKRALWSAKKQYAMLVNDSEGYRPEDPMLKVMGLAIKKSTTPEYLKEHLEICLQKILTDADEMEVIDYKDKLYDDFIKKHPSEYAINTAVNQIAKYQTADGVANKTPMNSKAAITHNFYVAENNLDVPPIKQGDKIKLVQLKVPNPTGSNVFGFDNVFPEELLPYVDHKKAFEKAFNKPLEKLTNAMQWKMNPVTALEGLI